MFEDIFSNQDNELELLNEKSKAEAEATANEWDTKLPQQKKDTWSTGQIGDGDVWSVG